MDGPLLLKFGWILLLKCKLFEVMKLALFELRGIFSSHVIRAHLNLNALFLNSTLKLNLLS